MHGAVVADGRSAAVGKFMHVLLADYDRSRTLQPSHNFGILRRNAIRENRAGASRFYTSGVDQILQSESRPSCPCSASRIRTISFWRTARPEKVFPGVLPATVRKRLNCFILLEPPSLA
jgi:hypothetical protein